MRTTLTFLLLTGAVALSAQAPAAATLAVNRVQATVLNDGRFFTDGQTGQFIAPYAPGQSTPSLLRGAGLWLAGLDPGGNLKMAIATPDATDFAPGRPSPDGGSLTDRLGHTIWRVTRAEIDAHRADFADNGKIDNPQPGVFGWPGNDNPFFAQYNNGNILPTVDYFLAGYYDSDSDGRYNPGSGDYPALEVRGCPLTQYPDEMLWYVFNDHTANPHPVSGTPALNVEVQVTVFAYQCSENSPLGNSVFTRFKVINRGLENLDNAYFALLNDFIIGDGKQEYAGCDPDRQMAFAYPGNPAQGNLPTIGADLMRGPLDALANPLSLSSMVPFDPAQLASPTAIYNLLKGLNPDGSPTANNGFPYPDNPLSPNGQSELTAGNTPGNRAVLAAYGPFQLLPGAVNEIIVAHTFADNSGLDAAINNVQPLYRQSDLLQRYFDNCFNAAGATNLCARTVLGTSKSENPDKVLRYFPNPSAGRFVIQSDGSGIRRVTLYDLLGRAVHEQRWSAAQNSVELRPEALVPGTYLAQVENENAQVSVLKIQVQE